MADSLLYPGERIIDEHSPFALTDPSGYGKGYEGMHPDGYGATPYDPLPDSFLIDRSEWEDRANEKEKTQSRLSDIIVYKQLPPKNQQRTDLCWSFGVTGAQETVRALMNQPTVSLSPASVAGPVTGWKNVGGWGYNALKQGADKGWVPSKIWPDTAVTSKNLYTAENQKIALDYRCTEWFKLLPNHLEQAASCVLQNIPVPAGYDWWGHLIFLVDLVFINGVVCFRIRNSWGDIPDFPNGFGILKGNRAIPNDAVAPRQAIAA